MRYLYAFDLSMDCTGVCIFDMDTQEVVKVTSIQTNKKQSHGQRLRVIAKRLEELMEEYPPHTVAIERGFSRFNTSTQVIYRVHGLVNYMFDKYKQAYYPPKSVKEAILRGNATKKQVQDTINKNYPDVKFENEDESDAFAVGLTYFAKN